MARIRSIKPDYWTDEKVVELSPFARLLFIGLWNFADDDGRMVFSPKRIKMQIFPADDLDALELIRELHKEKLVEIYTESRRIPPNPPEDSEGYCGGEEAVYMQVVNFDKHQKVDKRSPSKYPPPPDAPAESPRIPPNPPGRKGREGKGGGREGRGEEHAHEEISFR